MKEDEARMLARAIVDEVVARIGIGQRDTKPANPAEPRFMPITAFAKSRGFARSTVQGYVAAGMPSVKVRGGRRIDVQAADEWLRIGAAGRDGLHS